MPGAQNADFRPGTWTELLVESCLSAIAFTTRVPRQEDVGHDFICTLYEPKNRMLWTGLSFTVQAKSDARPLIFKEPYAVKWITELENPFFIAVANRENLSIDIYSTWFRLNGFLRKKAERIVLKPGLPTKGRPRVWTAEDRSEQIIALGNPIISATMREFVDRRTQLREILKQWVKLDRRNIVRNEIGLHYVTGPHPAPETYQANEPITHKTPRMGWVYSNPKNRAECERNFGLSATALRLTILERAGGDNEVEALDAVLHAYWDKLDPLCQSALRKHKGFDHKQR